MSDIYWHFIPQKSASSCLFVVTVGTFKAPVLDDLRQQFDALKESMMPEGVKPLRAAESGNQILKSVVFYLC